MLSTWSFPFPAGDIRHQPVRPRAIAIALAGLLLACSLAVPVDARAQSPQSAARAAPASATSPAGAAGSTQSPRSTLEPGTMQARLAACTACHGEQGRAGADGYYPRLAGKPQDYLYHQLLNFRDGRRQYQPMAHLLRDLPDAYLRDIAAWFADQHPPYPAPATPSADAAQMARGSQLVHQGDKARGLPACSACHGAALSGVLPAIPGLLGLPRDYIGAQIGSWQSGLRRAATPDCMADIARRLQPEDVAAVAAWLSAQPVPQAGQSGAAPTADRADYVPAPAGSLTLPVQCGSQEDAR